MIFKYHGKDASIEGLKKGSQVGTTGVSLLGLSEAAEKYGFRTRGLRVTFEQLLMDAPLPCILHWQQYHFVVLTPSASKKRITIADPARGLITYTRKEFLDSWVTISENGEEKGIALLLTPTASFHQLENEKQKEISWGLLSRYALNYKKEIAQLCVGMLIGSLLQLIFPFLAKSMIDTGINSQNLTFVQIILVAQFTLFFAQTVVEFIRSRILLFVSTQINLAILSDFWIKLMRLPLNFFDSRQTGDILQRIADNHRIERFITGTALQTLFSMFNLVVFSIVLLTFNTTIFAVFFLGSAMYLLWIRIFLGYRKELDYRRFSASARETAYSGL